MKDENTEKSFSKWTRKNASNKFREALDNEKTSWNEKNLEFLLNSDDWLPGNVSFDPN